MKNAESINWNRLLDRNNEVSVAIEDWALGRKTSRDVAESLAKTPFAGEFRRLVRSRGTHYGRNLARKALKYRGLIN